MPVEKRDLDRAKARIARLEEHATTASETGIPQGERSSSPTTPAPTVVASLPTPPEPPSPVEAPETPRMAQDSLPKVEPPSTPVLTVEQRLDAITASLERLTKDMTDRLVVLEATAAKVAEPRLAQDELVETRLEELRRNVSETRRSMSDGFRAVSGDMRRVADVIHAHADEILRMQKEDVEDKAKREISVAALTDNIERVRDEIAILPRSEQATESDVKQVYPLEDSEVVPSTDVTSRTLDVDWDKGMRYIYGIIDDPSPVIEVTDDDSDTYHFGTDTNEYLCVLRKKVVEGGNTIIETCLGKVKSGVKTFYELEDVSVEGWVAGDMFVYDGTNVVLLQPETRWATAVWTQPTANQTTAPTEASPLLEAGAVWFTKTRIDLTTTPPKLITENWQMCQPSGL